MSVGHLARLGFWKGLKIVGLLVAVVLPPCPHSAGTWRDTIGKLRCGACGRVL